MTKLHFLFTRNKKGLNLLGLNLYKLGVCRNFQSGINCSFQFRRAMSQVRRADNRHTFCLNDYDVVGFDLDHTLCKYRLKAISQLIYNNMCKFLTTKKNYPSNIFGSFQASARFYQRGLVIDTQKGNFLKLADDFTIIRATHGTQVLTSKEIEQTYGTAKVWEPTKNILHELCENKSDYSRPFRCLQDFFVIPGPYICARIVDYLDTLSEDSSQVYSFWIDVLESISDMYRRECFKENTGGYFPALRQNLPSYVNKCSNNTLEWIKRLKANKKVFLMTGSHYDYATFLLDYIMGEDWRDNFDICITYARKPKFFFETPENQPFLQLDGFQETSPVPEDGLQERGVYSQGNWKELNKFFERLCGKQRPQVLYFGDVITDDVYAGSRYLCCDSVSILEEMAAEGMDGVEPDEESAELLNSSLWGSFFSTNDDGVIRQPLWSSVVMQYGQIAIPSLSVMSTLPLKRRIPSFSSGIKGFYPGVPTAFNVNSLQSKI